MKYAFVVFEDINIGAGYVMAHLRKEGHEVKLFFDPLQYKRGYARNKFLGKLLNISDRIIKGIERYKPDVCCFSAVTAVYAHALQISKRIKETNNCKIVFGGVHATLMPEVVKTHEWIDEVVVGDGLAHFGGKFEPDKLWPDRESFLKLLPPIHRKYQLFMTSFGCPFNCSFCGNEQLRKVKQFKMIKRSREGCIKELQHLKERGMKYVLFVDDIFTCDSTWLGNFLSLYSKHIGLPFCCFGHPKYLKEEVIKKLSDAGCHTIWIGVQTADERIRKQILNRPETNKEIMDACALIKKYKMKLIVDHIFGIPTENELSQEISYNLYNEIQPDILNCYELVYFPKAKINDIALKTGYLTPASIERINNGEGVTYQVGNSGKKFYDEYAKSFISLTAGGIAAEFLPVPLIKLIAYLKAGRGFIPAVMIQNELWFTARALCSKLSFQKR